MLLPAQRKSCVLQAVAHDYVNTMCSYNQPSTELLWEASSSYGADGYSVCRSVFMNEEREGTRGRGTDFVVFVCLEIVRLLALSFLVLKDQGQLKCVLLSSF